MLATLWMFVLLKHNVDYCFEFNFQILALDMHTTFPGGVRSYIRGSQRYWIIRWLRDNKRVLYGKLPTQ